MARRVFFTFHYHRDIMRVNIVRNHWLTKLDAQSAGYWDHSLWEETKKKGDEAIQRMIDDGLVGSSVTAILIGQETAGRKWVNYELTRSHELGKGIIGIYIHKIKNIDGSTDLQGHNPLDDWTIQQNGQCVRLSSIYPTYDWITNSGYNNFADWVEKAAKQAGR
jgi:MTH538 TIR-like domain (DUF1863)